jgi:nucleotide-binding universal stress UspA family protein
MVERSVQLLPAMRVVIALEPAADPGWVAEGIGTFPLTDPLDLVLVCALDIPRPPLTSPGPAARRLYGGAIAGLRREAQQGAETVVETVRAALSPRAGSVAVRIVDGRPVPVILHAARSWNADLVLVGGSARGALRRALLGSVSDEVVRAAPCPVLVVKRRVARFERMLVATDGSLHAEAALRFVAALPVPPTAELRVCAVSETPDVLPRSDRDGRAATVLLLVETEKRLAVQAVTRALDILTALSCPIQSSVRHGDARRELADEVRRWIPDLLVIGARGRTAGSQVGLGRVTESLLREAACPTLVYRG